MNLMKRRAAPAVPAPTAEPAKLPAGFAWLTASLAANAGAPSLITAALDEYGVHEGVGDADNPEIIGWAKSLGIKDYKHDVEPWCGLFMAVIAARCGFTPPEKPIWALNWRDFADHPADGPALGDVLVFRREDSAGDLIGGHVGIYIGEDTVNYFVLGGNQGDSVSIVRILKVRLHTFRRPPFGKLPANVKPVALKLNGELSSKGA